MPNDEPKVSPTCEVLTGWNGPSAPAFCDAPSTHWYPADGGGTMALCEVHARAHPYAARVGEPWTHARSTPPGNTNG